MLTGIGIFQVDKMMQDEDLGGPSRRGAFVQLLLKISQVWNIWFCRKYKENKFL